MNGAPQANAIGRIGSLAGLIKGGAITEQPGQYLTNLGTLAGVYGTASGGGGAGGGGTALGGGSGQTNLQSTMSAIFGTSNVPRGTTSQTLPSGVPAGSTANKVTTTPGAGGKSWTNEPYTYPQGKMPSVPQGKYGNIDDILAWGGSYWMGPDGYLWVKDKAGNVQAFDVPAGYQPPTNL